jgi:predicted O-linked N-acetylglucosamine transferase (SPINDLY family)
MKAIDWRITDARLDPEGATEHLSRERLARLAGSYACFRPHPGSPEIGPSPAQATGFVTFASFNNAYKINDAVVALWARLVSSVPRARLVMVVEHGELPDIRRLVSARFEAQGLDPARLDITGRQSVSGFLRMCNSVDVLLDPFPQNGGITSLHALWMGVPFITLAGKAPIGRIGVSLLGQLGLDSFVARDQDEYVAIAQRCAADPDALAALRAGIRSRMQASPLMDEPGFMRDLESAYRGMWREWCGAR